MGHMQGVFIQTMAMSWASHPEEDFLMAIQALREPRGFSHKFD